MRVFLNGMSMSVIRLAGATGFLGLPVQPPPGTAWHGPGESDVRACALRRAVRVPGYPVLAGC